MTCSTSVFLNSLWAMLAGHRFDLDDQRLVDLLDIVHKCFRMIDPSGGLLNQMPPLRFIAPRHSGYTNLMTHLNRIWNFLRETIDDHRKSFNADNMRDLIDLFLREMETSKCQNNSSFEDLQLVSLCLDLFMAGSETTSNTLGFAVLYMLLYPQVQRRVQDELDRCVGTDRQPLSRTDAADKQHLRYLEAVLMEIQRHATIAPSGIPHKALKNTVLMGHTIPKGTTVLVSMWSLHRDVQHWGDPEVFRPERFISGNGNIKQDDWFMPFGIGKRRCIGETLAKASLFLFFSTLLHNFSILPSSESPLPSLEGYDGVTLSPKPFSAKLIPRK
ncbi:hypothetical protein L9F63_025607 [Diploptera punctata]|uniref:Cytochrome P450 n=1 Tax=Diploptera punctata TaxID=6984 RepID=A0AAD7ZAA1_DIPPU|nr:hypothetical protein L9F63_025607 [Diploptera punctata]